MVLLGWWEVQATSGRVVGLPAFYVPEVVSGEMFSQASEVYGLRAVCLRR